MFSIFSTEKKRHHETFLICSGHIQPTDSKECAMSQSRLHKTPHGLLKTQWMDYRARLVSPTTTARGVAATTHSQGTPPRVVTSHLV